MSAAPRVLVAEDEALIRMDLVEMLREEGYEVVGEAADGETVVELARELRPDLVIVDIKMPRMDGLTAAEQITEERIAPVVVITAFGHREQVERATSAGAMAYLVKPFHQHDLVPAMEVARARFTEITGLRKEVADLSERLEVRKVVDRAKSALMERHSLSEAEAFAFIQRAAMDHRTSMRLVAERVLEAGE